MKTFIPILLTLFLSSSHINASGQQDSAIDDIGDIAFVAYSYGSQDGYAFVLLDDCPNGTVIKFIDEEWTGSSFHSTNGEGENTWTNNTGTYISKGTVIIVQNADNNPSVNIGTVTESNAGFDIASSSPDQIFAIIGSRASPTFLTMVGHTSLPNNGSGARQTLSGTGLVEDSTSIYLATEKIYKGPNTCGTLSSCHTSINDNANWQTISGSVQFPKDVYSALGGSALPVLLTVFELKETQDSIHLHWITASEINNQGFFIQCKTQLGSWKPIAFIDGQGTTSVSHRYTYSFTSMPTETVYYRLKQVDYDGQYTFSNVLQWRNEVTPSKNIYWYQSEDDVVFDAYTSRIQSIELYNHLGKKIYQSVTPTQPVHVSLDYFSHQPCYALLKTDERLELIVVVVDD